MNAQTWDDYLLAILGIIPAEKLFKGVKGANDLAKTAKKLDKAAEGGKDAGKAGTGLGTIYVDSKGNAIVTPPGGRITSSPDGKFIQVRDANGNPTGVRIDGGHNPRTHTDPRSLEPHAHVPGATNGDGTPWLPIKK
jgi:hypothetical protein